MTAEHLLTRIVTSTLVNDNWTLTDKSSDKHCIVNDSQTLTDKSSDKHSLVNDKWTLTDKSSDKHIIVNDSWTLTDKSSDKHTLVNEHLLTRAHWTNMFTMDSWSRFTIGCDSRYCAVTQ